jgi:hypothetical protein
MASGWPAALAQVGLWAAAAVQTGTSYYIGLAVLIAILIGVLIWAYRTWAEINDVEEPDSPAELLESFEQAHEEGELDAQELERVRRLLSTNGGAGAPGDGKSAQAPAVPREDRAVREE